MATTSQQVHIEDLVTCTICMEYMKDPKHLNCQHAFCAQCLQDWMKQPGNPKRSIVCPVCRTRTTIHEGIEKLPTDIGVNKLLDVLEVQKRKEDKLRFACGADGSPDVVAFCESCDYQLCRGCLDNHVHNQSLWSHLLYIADIPCTQHLSKIQNMYCLNCQQVGCDECMNEHHQNHETACLAVVAKLKRSVLQDLFQPLQDMVNTQEKLDTISIYSLERTFEDLKYEIESHARKGHKMLGIWKKAILADLRSKGDKLGKEVSGVEYQLSKVYSLVSYMKRFLREGSDFQLVTAFSATSQQLEKTTNSVSHIATRQKDVDCDLAFVPEPMPKSYGSLMLSKDTMKCTQKEDNRSRVSVKAETPAPANMFCQTCSQALGAANSFSPSSHPLAAAKSFCSISSQTTHSGEIPLPPNTSGSTQNQASASGCAAPQRAILPKTIEFHANVWIDKDIVSTLDLHDQDSSSTERSHKVLGFFQWLGGTKDEDLKAHATVFLCNQTGHLYIGEEGWWTKGNLWRLDSCTNLPEFLHKSGKQKVMPFVRATSVTISPVDGTIAACIGNCIAVHKFGNMPTESPRGSIRYDTISFPTAPMPFSIAISNTHWVVLDKKNSLVRIGKYSDGKDAHVLTFGSVGSGQGQFVEPSHVCCDSIRDLFIVSDTGNNRIQVFDMSGNYLWEAGQVGALWKRLKKPWGLCLDGLGNIIVADSGNLRLVVLGWEKGDYLREIPTNIIPHSVTVDGRDDNVAYLVVAGLRGKMPVVQTRKFVSPSEHWGSRWGVPHIYV